MDVAFVSYGCTSLYYTRYPAGQTLYVFLYFKRTYKLVCVSANYHFLLLHM